MILILNLIEVSKLVLVFRLLQFCIETPLVIFFPRRALQHMVVPIAFNVNLVYMSTSPTSLLLMSLSFGSCTYLAVVNATKY